MTKSTINSTQKKKRGRPPKPEGRRLSLPISFPPEIVAAIDAHAAAADLTRSEAVRRLVESGLKAKGAKR